MRIGPERRGRQARKKGMRFRAGPCCRQPKGHYERRISIDERRISIAVQVVIRHPLTAFVTDGHEVAFDLPLVPRPRRLRIALWCAAIVPFFVFWLYALSSFFWAPIVFVWENAAELTNKLPIFLGVLESLVVVLLMLPYGIASGYIVEKLCIYAWQVLSPRPLLEIHEDCLIDRRELNRPVAWSELGDASGVRSKLWLANYGAPYPRFTLQSAEPLRGGISRWMRSVWFRRPIAVVDTTFFDIDKALLEEVIRTMVRNAGTQVRQTERTASMTGSGNGPGASELDPRP